MSKRGIALCLVVFLVCIGISVWAQESSPNRVVSEKLILQSNPSSWIPFTFKISPDNRRVAYATQSDNKQFVVVDGKEEKEKQYSGISIIKTDIGTLLGEQVDQVGTRFGKFADTFEVLGWQQASPPIRPIFSPDSKQIAYSAKVGDKWFVMVDGKEGKQYEGVSGLIFSTDSKRVAYEAKRSNKWFVVVDGKEGKRYDGTGGITFSPDSKRVVYAASRGDNWLIVTNGKEGNEYDVVGDLTLSLDGQHMAYGAKRGNKWFVVVDGKEGMQYEGVGGLISSPDSKRVAYGATKGNKWFVVVDGKEGKQYEGAGGLIFSPDSKRVAYEAKRSNKWFVVVDGKEGMQHNGIVRGGKIIFDSPNSLHYLALKGNEIYLVEERLMA